MSDPDNDRRRELEEQRLASDLLELAAATLNPHLKRHCFRMAELWSGQADQGPTKYYGIQSVLLH
jgi:hypothetical protein